MESIDRLREYVRGNCATENERAILRIADAIEREVEDNARFRAEAEPFHDRLCEAAEAREDVTLWGVDYTALPVDAEGVPIHVGDVMEWPDCSTAEVVGVGDGTFFYVEGGEDAAEWSCASDKVHHRAPTVEDVLREFADEVWNRYCNGTTASDSGVRELEAEYAAKLTLAGDE